MRRHGETATPVRIPAERPVDVVSLRTSQINGCAFFVDMRRNNAGAAGANEERLYSLDAWRESLLYSDRERAALDVLERVCPPRREFRRRIQHRARGRAAAFASSLSRIESITADGDRKPGGGWSCDTW